MVKGRSFLIVTTVSAWATPSAILEPREGTPCLPSCEKSPSSDSCKLCCGQVKHEVDWKCGAASSDGKAACCENWDEQCWNVASDQNLGHACNQCDSTRNFNHSPISPLSFHVHSHDSSSSGIGSALGVRRCRDCNNSIVLVDAAPSDGDGDGNDDDKDSDTSDDSSDSERTGSEPTSGN